MVTVTVNVTLALSAGVASETVFVTARSASGTSTPADAESLPVAGSAARDETVAVLVIGAELVTRAVTLSVSVAPLAIVPIVQTPAAKVPTDGVAESIVSPAGSVSATRVPGAASGPLFVTVTVNATVLLRAGVPSSTVLVIARSASATSTDAESVSLTGLTSNAPDVTVAVFVIGADEPTDATTVSVSVAPFATVPRLQSPAAYAPAVAVADVSVNPAGSASATWTAGAALGPLLASVTVNVTEPLAAGVASSTVLVTARSASGALTETVAESLAAFVSNVVVDAVAVLVTARLVVTVATTTSVAVWPLASVPIVHVPAA